MPKNMYFPDGGGAYAPYATPRRQDATMCTTSVYTVYAVASSCVVERCWSAVAGGLQALTRRDGGVAAASDSDEL